MDSGVLPEIWSVGLIKPNYKQKGEKDNPENYRPITLVICIGKLFAGILSNRLYTYVKNNDIFFQILKLDSERGTQQQIIFLYFIVYSLIEMLHFIKKETFLCFY